LFSHEPLSGVRIAKKNHGDSTARSDNAFVDRCVDFVDVQIRIIEPRAVILLGMNPTWEVFHRWLPGRPKFRTGVAIDEAGYACFSIERGTGSLKMGG
jgi:uracil-DNA glycosylase